MADALARRSEGETVQALHVSVGFAWEADERAMSARLFAAPPFAGRTGPPVMLTFDMRDVFPATHWAVRGTPPAFDTPDEDVFLDGRNVILTSKAAVWIAGTRARAGRPRACCSARSRATRLPPQRPTFSPLRAARSHSDWICRSWPRRRSRRSTSRT
jgi:hypothetical protein